MTVETDMSVEPDLAAAGVNAAPQVARLSDLAEFLTNDQMLSPDEVARLVRAAGLNDAQRPPSRLTPAQSDRLIQLLHIARHVRAAFGDSAKAARWLRRPSCALDGSTPLDLLGTELGTSRVETLLGQIEHGIAA